MEPQVPLREVVERIDVLHGGISARQRQLLRFVVRGDAGKVWQQDGCRDMAGWLSGRLGISNWAARRWVQAAHSLEQLPALGDALESGVLCLDKVLELARFATPETEKRLIAWARRVSAAAIRRKADAANAPDLDVVCDAEDSRFLRWWWFDDGRRLGLEGEFPAAQGAALAKAIRRAADQLPAMPLPEPATGLKSPPEVVLEQRCADAMLALTARAIAGDDDADRATVVVHTTLGPVCGNAALGGEIEDGPVIHPEVARRLSCDARLQFVLTDQDGNALGIGRAARNVPLWLMRELRHRDHGCTFPGCGTRAFLQAHHVVHWDHGGRTDLDNLVLTCGFHHKLVHEWNGPSVSRDPSRSGSGPTGNVMSPGPTYPRDCGATPTGPSKRSRSRTRGRSRSDSQGRRRISATPIRSSTKAAISVRRASSSLARRIEEG